jgi:hypothetical protein
MRLNRRGLKGLISSNTSRVRKERAYLRAIPSS